MLDSFLKKSSFCANGHFRVFYIALRYGGIPPASGIRNFGGGGVFIDYHPPPLFLDQTSLFSGAPYLEIQDFPTLENKSTK